MRKKIYNYLHKTENKIWSLYYSTIFRFNESYRIIRNNANYVQSKSGTCFIIGNGPSLKLEKRLGELAQYPVFTVNQFYRSELFEVVKPTYHVMVDPLFFNLDDRKPEELDTIKRMQKLALNKDVKLFFPVDSIKKIKNLIGDGNIVYVKGRYILHDGYSRSIRLDHFIPANRNVMQTAIEIAISLGYNRIILLGCDMTGLLDNYLKRSPDKQIETFSHVYEYTPEELLRMKKIHSMYSNEYMLEGFTQMFHDYRILFSYCSSLGITLLNASKETALDEVPFTNLDSILDEMRGNI